MHKLVTSVVGVTDQK